MLKTQLKNKMQTHTFKSHKDDYQKIKQNAQKFTAGNISEWIRYAALNHTPKKSDLVEPKATN